MTRKGFYILLAALHLLGFIKQCVDPHFLTLDSDDYLLLAQNILNHGIPYSGVILEGQSAEDIIMKGPFASRPLFYAVFIIITGAAKFTPYFLFLVQNILSIASIYLVEKLLLGKGLKLNYNIASIGVLFYPTLWIYANWIMAESLFMFLITFWIWQVVHKKYFKAGLILALCIITKPIVVFLTYGWLLFQLYQFIKHKKRSSLWSGLTPLIALIFLLLSNLYYTGAPIFSSMPAINLVQYNARLTISKLYGADSAESWVKQTDQEGKIIEKKNGFPETYSYKKSKAIKVLQKNFGTYALMHLEGSFRWTIDPGRFDILNFFQLYYEDGNQGWTRTFYSEGIKGIYERAKTENIFLLFCIILITVWNGIRLLIFLYKIPQWLKHQSLFITLILTVIYFAALSGPLASARFLMPAFPAVLALISVSFKQSRQAK